MADVSGTRHVPGPVVVLFDNRHCGPADASADQRSYFMTFRHSALSRLGWPSLYYAPDLDPGMIRLVWYTHAGAEGIRDYPLYSAPIVYEMFESLSEEGFRPMILSHTNENPYPTIGGTPAPEPDKPRIPQRDPRVAKYGVSQTYSGHGGPAGSTPFDRVTAIIEREEEREAKKKRELFERQFKADELVV